MELMLSTVSTIGAEKLMFVAKTELDWLLIIYWTGVVISGALLLIKLVGVKRQMALPEKGAAFSFWKTKIVDQELSEVEVIQAHENVHVKQFHTLDILFVELIGIFFWFNPLIYCYRRSLKFIHEYLADEHAANFAESKKQYAMVLFLQSFKTGPALTNTFQSATTLESRIKMLQRKKSKHYRLWKYTLCLPLIVLLTVMCSFRSSNFRTDKHDNNKVDKAASFPGGFELFKEYLIKTTRKVSNQKGSVMVSFVVEKDGEVTNGSMVSGLDEATDKEAIRLVESSPKWEPALQNGKKVRSSYQMRINF
ncbi:hypothetical protein AQF98_13980 [Pedobacter sp. Hv1]|nr:hypothetical protein AQF98_13980 [Pedobacter sp. Hv1]